MEEKLYFNLHDDHYYAGVFTPSALIKYLKENNDMEKVTPPSYTITPVWMTKKEYAELEFQD